MDDKDLDNLLRAARADTAPLSNDIRDRVLAEVAPPRPAPAPPGASRWAWLAGLIALPGATALGLVLGLNQPALLYEPWSSDTATEAEDLTADDALLEDVFGLVWTEGETG